MQVKTQQLLLFFDLHYLLSFVIPTIEHTTGMNHLEISDDALC
jgi:hypothetical protein